MEANLFSFKVSSPGKVILHGEHSVVYGKPALAGVIGARNFLYFHEQTTDLIEFKFKSLGAEFKLPISEINILLKTIASTSSELCVLKEITNVIDNLDKSSDFREQERKALLASLFLLCGILVEKRIISLSNGIDLKISSEMSVGAGLGSSASFGVCLAASFFVFARLKNAEENAFDLSPEDKHTISKWAFQSEKIMHGTPSGVDNNVCTFGNIVKFSKAKSIEHIYAKSKINILLVDSKVSRSTANLVKQVAELKNQFPTIVDHILNGMEEIVEQAIPIYENISYENKTDFNKLEKLFDFNNNLLKAIGVSHPKLEEIFGIALANGFSSKITGAGGGGYALILLPENYKGTDSFEKLCSDLTNSHFSFTETTVGGTGLIVEQLE